MVIGRGLELYNCDNGPNRFLPFSSARLPPATGVPLLLFVVRLATRSSRQHAAQPPCFEGFLPIELGSHVPDGVGLWRWLFGWGMQPREFKSVIDLGVRGDLEHGIADDDGGLRLAR